MPNEKWSSPSISGVQILKKPQQIIKKKSLSEKIMENKYSSVK